MTADQVRAKLHQAVSAGAFDNLNTCRRTLHNLVKEWVDWAEVQYLTEVSYAKHDMEPPKTIQAPFAFTVIGALFYEALVSEASPGEPDELPSDD